MDKVMLLTSREELASLMNEIIQNIQNSNKENSEITRNSKREKSSSVKLLTTEDVCKMYKVSRVTINQWKKEGRLPFIKMSRRVYFREDDVLNAGRSFDFSKLNNF